MHIISLHKQEIATNLNINKNASLLDEMNVVGFPRMNKHYLLLEYTNIITFIFYFHVTTEKCS